MAVDQTIMMATPMIPLGFSNDFCNGFSLGLVLICFWFGLISSWVWDGFSSEFGMGFLTGLDSF